LGLLVILDPPHVLQAAHDPSDTNTDDSSIVNANDNINNATLSPELIPRGWWISNEDKTVYRGIKDTMSYLYDILEKNRQVPFDGVLGFSQGAASAATIIALLEGISQYAGPRPSHPPLRFGILISGFKPLDVELSPLFERSITTPTLHVLGRTDVVVSNARSQSLVNACESPRVEWHDGGHHIPAKTSWRTFFKAYLSTFESSSVKSHMEVPSPSAPATTSTSEPPSEANSGVVTPAG